METNIKPMDIIAGIEVYNICDFLSLESGMDYDAETALVIEWCQANDAVYYGACREDFSLNAAAAKAVREGKSRVVVEDLS